MKKFLAILVCKFGRAVGKLVGKGSSMPGKFALKICPDILARVQLPQHVIAVTGSNGKTSTVEMIAAILPYIMLNLGILGRRYKVFMGDAGSTLIGFTVIWILLETTQGKTHPISPVTALWIIAIPLMDMVAIMYRRLRKGMSPFSPDRQHIHHLIMRAGFTSRQAFVLITLAAALLASIGVLAEYSHFVPEWVMLVLFLLAFFLYGYCIKRAWKVARFIKRVKRRLRRNRGGSPNLTK